MNGICSATYVLLNKNGNISSRMYCNYFLFLSCNQCIIPSCVYLQHCTILYCVVIKKKKKKKSYEPVTPFDCHGITWVDKKGGTVKFCSMIKKAFSTS